MGNASTSLNGRQIIFVVEQQVTRKRQDKESLQVLTVLVKYWINHHLQSVEVGETISVTHHRAIVA